MDDFSWNVLKYTLTNIKKGYLSILLFTVLFFIVHCLVGLIALLDGEYECTNSYFTVRRIQSLLKWLTLTLLNVSELLINHLLQAGW